MSSSVEGKEVRNRIRRRIVEDGLLEVMIGIALILSSIHLMHRSFILNYLWLPFAGVLIELARKRFVYRYTGYAKISLPARDILTFAGISIAVWAILVGLLAVVPKIVSSIPELGFSNILFFSLIIYTMLFFFFVAKRFSVPRWYIHGILIAFVLILGKLMSLPWTVLGLGVWIMLVGIYVFIRFLAECKRRYQLDTDSDRYDK
jgi:hypothetical protein